MKPLCNAGSKQLHSPVHAHAHFHEDLPGSWRHSQVLAITHADARPCAWLAFSPELLSSSIRTFVAASLLC